MFATNVLTSLVAATQMGVAAACERAVEGERRRVERERREL